MKQFYTVDGSKLNHLGYPNAHAIATYCSSRYLTKDVQEWMDNAKHGDVFRPCNARWKVLCLELSEFGL